MFAPVVCIFVFGCEDVVRNCFAAGLLCASASPRISHRPLVISFLLFYRHMLCWLVSFHRSETIQKKQNGMTWILTGASQALANES